MATASDTWVLSAWGRLGKGPPVLGFGFWLAVVLVGGAVAPVVATGREPKLGREELAKVRPKGWPGSAVAAVAAGCGVPPVVPASVVSGLAAPACMPVVPPAPAIVLPCAPSTALGLVTPAGSAVAAVAAVGLMGGDRALLAVAGPAWGPAAVSWAAELESGRPEEEEKEVDGAGCFLNSMSAYGPQTSTKNTQEKCGKAGGSVTEGKEDTVHRELEKAGGACPLHARRRVKGTSKTSTVAQISRVCARDTTQTLGVGVNHANGTSWLHCAAWTWCTLHEARRLQQKEEREAQVPNN